MDKYLSREARETYKRLKSISDKTELAFQLDLVLKKPFSPQHIWLYKELFEKLDEEAFEKYHTLLNGRVMLEVAAGNLKAARRILEKMEPDSPERIFSELLSPALTLNEFAKVARKAVRMKLGPIQNLTLTAGRPSVINGFRDFTLYGKRWLKFRSSAVKAMESLYGDDEDAVFDVALAELEYQRDNCYDALVLVVSAIPILKEKEDARVLFAALFLQLEILLMNGQAKVAAPLLKDIQEQMINTRHDEYLPNLYALVAWAAMYDGDYEQVESWMNEEAPDEYGNFCMLDTFRYLIKMRGYIYKGNYFAMAALAKKLLPILKEGQRLMDICEVYMLLAMNDYARGDKENAFENVRHMLELAEKYRYDRMLADEGNLIYRLLVDYSKTAERNDYLDRIIEMSRKVARLYPEYLKGKTGDTANLSKTEVKVLRQMANGDSNADIAELLGISINTVKFHGKNIFEKLQVRSRGQAVKRAEEIGIL